MRKILTLMITALLLLGCAACGTGERAGSGPSSQLSMSSQASEAARSEKADVPEPPVSDNPVVYLTTDISLDGLMAVYEALGWQPRGEVAVKVHFGEPGGGLYLDPQLIGGLVQQLDGTFVETNTVSGGSPRANTALHRQIAEDHGFAAVAPIDILDEDGEIILPVEGGQHLTEIPVGSHIENYGSCIVLSHFKGQTYGGFSSAIRNMSVGMASVAGKCLIHTGGESATSWREESHQELLESAAEAATAVSNYFGENIIYINVMNNISLQCDCNSSPAAPDIHDIGILASADPVALEQACVDLVFAAPDGTPLAEQIKARNGVASLEYAEAIGLGSRDYRLTGVDGASEAYLQSLDFSSESYVRQLARERIAEFSTPDMGEYEKAKAAFDYMIEHTVMEQPIGLDLWRVHGGGEEAIPFVEQRALSPLRFGVGMCEDYAAALTILLQEMGLEAAYVPGLTYSLEGNLVDHAWTAAKIDGVWYHLDCQLEDNISRRGTIRYRYFMKGDATFAGSHRWGQNLIDSGLLTTEQNDEIEESYLVEPCPQDHATPEPYTFEDAFAPDFAALRQEATAEIAAYETEHGPLPPMQLDTIPPVFGLEGYGPPDEG